jgi:hypothetical protein
MADRGALWLALALGLTLASAGPVAGQAAEDPIPASLAQPSEQLRHGLDQLRDADEIERARQVHADQIQPPADQLAPYLADLAGEDGRLLATYLDRLDQALADGNLSDARSLAGAAANLVDDEVRPLTQRWDANRTALLAGPLTHGSEGLVVPLVLHNPPAAGLAAVDASLTIDAGEPLEAHVEHGQGDTHLDPANGTVRWASFETSSLAELDTHRTDRVLLGRAVVDTDWTPGETTAIQAHAHELLDPEGEPVPAVGVETQRTVPARDEGSASRWLALAGIGLAGLGLTWWVRRWEV